MNLGAFASGFVKTVNPQLRVSLEVSTGPAQGANFSRSPTFAPAVLVSAQCQPMTNRDLRMVDGLNLQGKAEAIYLSGDVEGIVRQSGRSGDKITFPDGRIWLVVAVLEDFFATGGWVKVAATQQMS